MNLYLVAFLACISTPNAFSFSFSQGDPLVKLTRRAAGYNLNMPENNHDANPKRALFSIFDADASLPPHLKEDPGFKYIIEGNSDKWIFYSTSTFDYETQLRFYVINLYVGEDFKTLTLLIDNVDDEPPTFSCPDNLRMLGKQLYDETTTPCSCTLHDPDGFLSQMKFNMKTGADKFEFLLPSDLSDNEQSSDVKLVNKVAFDSERDPFQSFIVEVKDGAGHNSLPIADTNIVVNIENFP